MARKRAREIVEDRVDRERRVEGAGQISDPSSPAKAGDPVIASVTDHKDREYWIPAFAGYDSTLASLPRLGPPPDTLIGKPERGHVLWAIDVTEIDDHRMGHLALQALQIECAILHPFGHDHHGVRAPHAGVGVVAIFDIGQFAPRLFDADRIVRAYLGAQVEQAGDQRD